MAYNPQWPMPPTGVGGYNLGPNPYGQVQPPTPQLSNLQQAAPVQTQQPVQLCGRVVANISEVTPNDIPMNGTVGLFPQSDYSCIFAKQWNQDGSISTIKFVPEAQTPTAPNEMPSDISQVILDKLDTLNEDVSRLTKQLHYRNNKSYNKTYRYDKDRNAKVEVKDDGNAQSD